tara:strand:+ start:207 stop:995 length:789 start_codon:yes stop_codon:yes gene_type:complete
MRTDDFIALTAPLRAVGGGRVWSLMISLFGDLAQESGTVIHGPVLSAMMNLLEIKPEAARVALHRLRNDGWIASEKSGRISQHSLTEKGRRESAAASPRIYTPPGNAGDDWQLVILEITGPETLSDMTALGFTNLIPRVYVGPATAPAPASALSLRGSQPPQWLVAQVQPEIYASAYADLGQRLKDLAALLQGKDRLSPLQIAVLRGLIVHNWRRLVLRHPPLPTALITPDGPAQICHVQVADMLTRFARPRLCDIDTQTTP